MAEKELVPSAESMIRMRNRIAKLEKALREIQNWPHTSWIGDIIREALEESK